MLGEIRKYTVPVTTDADGNATVYTDEAVTGRVLQMRYVPGAAPIDTGADLDVTAEDTGVVIANHDNIGTSAFTRAYRQATHDAADGAATLFAAAGEPVLDHIYMSHERIKVVIANGAAAKSGVFYFWVG